MSRCARSRRRLGRRGATALEFALVGAGLLLLIVAIIDFGRYFFTVHSVGYLVGEVAHEAILSTGTGCRDPFEDVLSAPPLTYAQRVPILKRNKLSLQVCVDPPGTGTNVSTLTRLTVTASYTFNFVLPMLAARTRVISDRTSMEFVRS
jgi:hypothetical protein